MRNSDVRQGLYQRLNGRLQVAPWERRRNPPVRCRAFFRQRRQTGDEPVVRPVARRRLPAAQRFDQGDCDVVRRCRRGSAVCVALDLLHWTERADSLYRQAGESGDARQSRCREARGARRAATRSAL